MDREKIYETFLSLARIGEEEDGAVSRLLFGEAYMEAVRQTEKYMKTAGLETWVDPCGNLHGFFSCGKPGSRTIYMGSHLDTVKEGGRYDGMLGVVGAVEAFRELRRRLDAGGEWNVNVHILATNGEEGNDLGGTFGSRAMTGLVDPDMPGFMERAAAYGLSREDLEQVRLPMDDGLCYLELHIEQGDTLDRSGEQIGIVTGIVGLERYAVTVYGESNHAGTTMMEYRKDALVGAAGLIREFDRLARELGHQMVATVGTLSVFPGTVSVIPERAEMVLEIRNLSRERMGKFMELAREAADRLPDVTAEFRSLVKKAPVPCSEELQDRLETICMRHQCRYRRMSSGATHDGNAMASKMPIGMIFVPSRDGISHNRREFTQWEDAVRGMEILADLAEDINRSPVPGRLPGNRSTEE